MMAMQPKPTAPQRSIVDVEHLRHYFGASSRRGTPVLDDVNLTLVEGEIVGLLGRSGSGKSTLLRSIAGLITPDEGEVKFHREADTGSNDIGPDIAMVFQTFALFPWLTVLENVELGLEARGVAKDARRERAIAAIDLIGLDGFENAYPKELSGGMRQRVGLARAIVVDPTLLLLDEPFSALDVLTAETLRTDLLDLWFEGRMPIKAMLIVTHNIEEAVLMCDRILVFSANPGRVAAEIRVDLPQPRERLDPAFRQLVDDIYARMTARPVTAIPSRDGPFPGSGITMILPRVSTNSLSGLMEEVEGPPFDGTASLSDLADAADLEVDELLPIAESLQQLHFAEVKGADFVLTAAGRQYVNADVDERKALFAQALLTHVPLAGHIRRILDERANKTAPARRFRDELEDHMSEEYADETLRTVTLWGRYAEIFAFDEDDDLFSLEDPQ